MGNTIKIKRGNGVPGSGVLSGNELGWDYLNNSLYIGVQGTNPIKLLDAFGSFVSVNKTTGEMTLTGLASLDGGINVNDLFTVDTVGNILGVTFGLSGLASLDGGINVNDLFTVDTVGNIVGNGTLTINGSTVLGDSLDDIATIRGNITLSDIGRTVTVKGSSVFDGNIQVGVNKVTINATTGAISTVGGLNVDGATYLNDLLDVDGTTTLRNTLSVSGDSTFSGVVQVNNSFSTTGNVTLGNATIIINGPTSINEALTVTGLTSLDGGIDVNSKVTVSASTGDIVTAGSITAYNMVINNDLTVLGTTTTINSTIVEITDPIFTIGDDTILDTKDRGIEFKYFDNKRGFFGLDTSTGRFVFIPDATNTSEVFSGNTGDFELGEIYQKQTDGSYDPNGTLVNASELWNNTAASVSNLTSGTQYDILLANAVGVFEPTKTIPAEAGLTIDCGEY